MLAFTQLTDIDVIHAIHSLRNKPSEGSDGINTELLKLSLPVTLSYITHIINLSLGTNTFPSAWKKALIVPIYKRKGSMSDPSSYRPIALLPIISKLTEKVVLNQLTEYMHRHDILSATQHAFRKQHSTETALLEVTDRIWRAMDKQMVTSNILIDLSKAFDMVNHNTLLCKLEHYGITPDWFKSYLVGRSQAVRGGDHSRSEFLPTTRGVPQGSCLGPVLFSMYTNDLPQLLTSDVTCYADDTQIMASYHPINSAETALLLQNDLNTIEKWMTDNSLKVNGAKTQVITFGTSQQLAKIKSNIANSLSICGSTPEQLNTVHNLGVSMDENLTFNDHAKKTSTKATGALIRLAKARNLLSKRCQIQSAQALSLSHLHYCTNVWSCAGSTTLKMLERVLSMASRVCHHDFNTLQSIVSTKLTALRARAATSTSSTYITASLIRNTKGNIIKPRVTTCKGQKQLAFRLA